MSADFSGNGLTAVVSTAMVFTVGRSSRSGIVDHFVGRHGIYSDGSRSGSFNDHGFTGDGFITVGFNGHGFTVAIP